MLPGRLLFLFWLFSKTILYVQMVLDPTSWSSKIFCLGRIWYLCVCVCQAFLPALQQPCQSYRAGLCLRCCLTRNSRHSSRARRWTTQCICSKTHTSWKYWRYFLHIHKSAVLLSARFIAHTLYSWFTQKHIVLLEHFPSREVTASCYQCCRLCSTDVICVTT